MGSAIECFEGAAAVNVPRSRFAPVKGTSDLFALRSDAYNVGEDGRVQLVDSRHGKPPIVNFSTEYKLVDALEGLGQPSLLESDTLEISGPVEFAEGVVIKGRVTISNDSSDVKIIAPGVYSDQSLSL
jgi:hypothetical protein